jgi:DNA-binding FrmR family transcriptional regulator
MIDEGCDCEDLVTELAAISPALDRAGVAIISSGLCECVKASGEREPLDTDKLEKLLLSVA